MPSRVEAGNASTEPCADDADKSVGKDKALVVGCNANNGNASARTANCNNAVSNGNDNYAGAFAVNKVNKTNTKHLTTQPTRLNIADNHTAIGGCGWDECQKLPFWDGKMTYELSQSSMIATYQGIDHEKNVK